MAPKIISPLLLSFFFLLLEFTCHASDIPKLTTGDNGTDHTPIFPDHETDFPKCAPLTPPLISIPVFPQDIPPLQFAQNIEHIECEWFLFGAFGFGLDAVEPELALGGPPPVGVRKANLDEVIRKVIAEFGYQEVGHLRALKQTVGGITRPLIDLSPKNFARLVDEAFGYNLDPPFDPYANTLNYLIGSYCIPYLGLLGYVGTNQNLNGLVTKRLLAGLLTVESEQDGIIRGYLFLNLTMPVPPYNITVAEFTDRISYMRNKLAMCGIKDEGLFVPRTLGAEQKLNTNVVSADKNSLGYARTPQELLRILYETGNEHIPGGFLPQGGNGEIARRLLGDI
ncbi:desiccation-related protein PCC13-62-like [Asparagus officinalis]|nr:desiccation-related protein PCC13-62-like [Asparagus officinalis]